MSDLRQEFERLRPMLLQEGRKLTHEGAYARAMLNLVPAFITHLEREAKHGIKAEHVFDGNVNALANVLLHLIRTCIQAPKHQHALENALRHLEAGVLPKLSVSAGGVILPGANGGVLQ